MHNRGLSNNLVQRWDSVFDVLVAIYNQTDSFNGAFVDTGAQKSVLGKRQAKAYCNEMSIRVNPKRREIDR